MKRLFLCMTLVALAACSQADAKKATLGQYLGELPTYTNGVFELTTPSGVHCVALIVYGRPSLSCDFSK